MSYDYLTIYDQNGDMLGVLENADNVGYTLTHNDLWTATFSLPSNDPKNSYCQAHNMVHLPDGARDTGLYRIIGMPTGEETEQGGVKTYSLEHVMATLLDDVLFGYHEIGGEGVTTEQVMRYILDRQQVKRWELDTCEFSDEYAYKFENTTLLSALLSLGNVLTEEYTWIFDTSTMPWKISLKHADASPGCGIHYMRNMVGIEKEMDASTLVTRLYLLGYGEGVNQLTIRDVNNGLPYIDADTASKWGTKSSVYADTRIEDAATLKARGLALLEKLKNPYISYTASAIDLTQLTGQEWDKHMPGRLVRVLDGEHGIDFHARIVSIAKSNVRGRNGDIEITIANAPRDSADSINTLADRMGIGELYSQGATNLYSQQYADNANPSHPATMRVYVPSGCVRINKMLLSWQLEAFRAYETGAAAGGATATTTSSGGASTQTSGAGGASERTSRSGGASTVTTETKVSTVMLTGNTGSPYTGAGARDNTGAATVTINDCGALVTYGSGTLTTASGGAVATTSNGGGNTDDSDNTSHSHSCDSTGSHYHNSGSHRHANTDTQYTGYSSGVSSTTTGSHSHSIGSNTCSHKHYVNAHSHTGGSHTHGISSFQLTVPSHGHSAASHSHAMYHYHSFDHSHNIIIPALTVTVPAHSHTFETTDHTHSITIPSHDHNLTLTDHTHDILYGIYEGATAQSVTLKVDGTEVPADEISRSEMDIVAYLSKDDDGKIRRGTWHEIEIVPSGLTRIEANLFVQTFVQSVGGGDY